MPGSYFENSGGKAGKQENPIIRQSLPKGVWHVNAKQIWQTILERVRTRVEPAIFTTWFQGTSAVAFREDTFVIRVPTTFAKSQLEGRFYELVHSLLTEATGREVEIEFLVVEEVAKRTVQAMEGNSSGTLKPSVPKRIVKATRERLAHATFHSKESTHGITETPAAPVMQVEQISKKRQEIHKDYSPAPIMQQELSASVLDEMEDEVTLKSPSIKVQPRIHEHSPAAFAVEGVLNPKYTFSSFIVGKSNKLAHATCLAVAENPGRVYNPLFLFGGVGLGKTHLLHAIGHAGEASGLSVLYTTSEKFTNEIVNAIRYQKTEEFRAKYRQIDILLVDDIQFIAGKESTEEEFFHTFNFLHNANKQIVVTSDRPPKAINSLQDRLRSRFEWGLLADVQAPEYEHRLAILRSKCESLRFTVPASVIEYVARPECSSVRELEGALNRVIAYATLHDQPLTIGLAAQALEHIYSKKPAVDLTVTEVFEGICRYYNVDGELLRGKQRDRDIVWPRQVAMYLMREETAASLLQIGAALGGRDHTTIMHGWEKVHAEIANNDKARQEIAAVLESIQPH
jgi:chromosomal replication initiator protein